MKSAEGVGYAVTAMMRRESNCPDSPAESR